MPESKDKPCTQNDAAKEEKYSKEHPENQSRGDFRSQFTHRFRGAGRSLIVGFRALLAAHRLVYPLLAPVSFGQAGSCREVVPLSAAQQTASQASSSISDGLSAARTGVAGGTRRA
jgi:hypothetical protein